MSGRMIRIGLCIFLLSIFMANGEACLWDRDTVAAEKLQTPSALETITGRFYRHSVEVYRWRIQDRTRRLKHEPNSLSWMDDLAVSLDKIGESAKAEEIARQQLEIDARRYESLANLGTFLVHQQKYEEGLAYLRQAIEVNPQAHFGREIVQIHLVEYIVAKQKHGALELPLQGKTRRGFGDFLRDKLKKKGTAFADSVVPEYTQGILSIMRFSKHDSPILLEVLGDLLSFGETSKRQSALGCRAYLRASMIDKEHRSEYTELAKYVTLGTDVSFDEVQKNFSEEVSEAEKWFQDFARREASWIKLGKDVDAENDLATRIPLEIVYPFPVDVQEAYISPPPMDNVWRFGIAIGVSILVLASIVLWRIRLRRSLQS